MLRGALMLMLLLAPGLAAARWYQVEVVVFRHKVAASAGGEQWPATTELPEFGDSMDLITDLPAIADEPADTQVANAPGPIAFKTLARNERGMNDVERRLRNSSEYALLLSAAWRQPSFGVSGAKRVHLRDIDTHAAARVSPSTDGGASIAATPRIEGTVAVKVARQMSVDIDFIYDHDGTPVRLKAARGMKLREVHYFDHPLFGVLVQVVPYDLPDQDPAAGSGSDEPIDEGAASGVDAAGAIPEPD